MIRVKDFLNMAFSYEDGMQLREKILDALKEGSPIVVDFEGIFVFTTMFFNACSGHFVLSNSIDWYNKMITFTNLNDMGAETHRHSIENAQKKRSENSAEITKKTLDDNT